MDNSNEKGNSNIKGNNNIKSNNNIKGIFEALNPTEEQSGKMFHEISLQSRDKTRGRKEYAKRRIIMKPAIAAAIAVVLLITSVSAAKNFDVLKAFFMGNGDFSLVQQFIKTPQKSVSDGRFKLTLEEVLTDNQRLFMAYSVEGLTDDAIDELMNSEDLLWDNDFKYKISVSPSPGICTGSVASYKAYACEIKEKRTATTRYWSYYDEMKDVGKEPVSLRLNGMEGQPYIAVPTDCNVERKELVLAGQPYGEAQVQITPIGITIEKGAKNDQKDNMLFTNTFFRMKNGEIKTYDQLTFYSGLQSDYGFGETPNGEEAYSRYRYSAYFRNAVLLSEFKSIIVDDIEYDINDPAKASRVEIDTPSPIKQNAVFQDDRYWLSLREICEKLGADMEQNGHSMTVRYRGVTATFTQNSNTFVRDGQEFVSSYSPNNTACVYNDEFLVVPYVFAEALYVGTSASVESFDRYKREAIIEDPEKQADLDTSPGLQKIEMPDDLAWYIIP